MSTYARLLQSSPPLCDPMDCSPPGSCVHGILQARILEWVAIPFSKESSWPRDRTWVSCIGDGFFTNLSHQGHPLYINIYTQLNHFAYLKLTQHCKSTILQLKIKRKKNRDVANGPMVKTPSFYSRGRGFDPWLWSSDPTTPSSAIKRNKTKEKMYLIKI